MSVQTKQATVYFAPTAGRRYFTKSAAINKEARAIIKKHFPDEPAHDCSDSCGWCQDPGWSFEHDQRARFERYYRMLTFALKRTMQ